MMSPHQPSEDDWIPKRRAQIRKEALGNWGYKKAFKVDYLDADFFYKKLKADPDFTFLE